MTKNCGVEKRAIINAQLLKAESLAVVGLIVALIALGYNTWRNELSEQNQTMRYAGFEMLLKVGELQHILYTNAAEDQMPAETAKRGEIVALSLRDLSMFMPEDVQIRCSSLVAEWCRQQRVPDKTIDSTDLEISLALVDTELNRLRLGIIGAVKALE